MNQRLAAHRNRRGGPQDGVDPRAQESPRAASGRAAEAAARVAARYAKAPSYSALLAGEARAVVRAAGAAAEAARNAQAAAQAVLAGLESGPIASGTWEPEPQTQYSPVQETAHVAPARWQDEPPAAAVQSAQVQAAQEETSREPVQGSARAGARPRWQETLPAPASSRDVWSEMRVHPSPEPAHGYRDNDGYGRSYGGQLGHGSDEGELFPYDAVANATVEPVQHLPANLIEFPRELVATRKARPRLAEGPFYDASHQDSQLSIFEVDPAVLAAPVYLSDTPAVAPPEWASIELDHHPEPVYAENIQHGRAYAHPVEVAAGTVEAMPVDDAMVDLPRERENARAAEVPVRRAEIRQNSSDEQAESRAAAVEMMVAPMSDRLLAGVVDGALVTLAFLAAAVVVIASTEHPPAGRMALVAAGFGLLLFGLLYQWLFLSYAEEGTPGMRYARIALCTFDDDNPSREQMRMRIPAMVLAAVPAGLGLLWALFDGERLGWHDRWTRTYQRKY